MQNGCLKKPYLAKYFLGSASWPRIVFWTVLASLSQRFCVHCVYMEVGKKRPEAGLATSVPCTLRGKFSKNIPNIYQQKPSI